MKKKLCFLRNNCALVLLLFFTSDTYSQLSLGFGQLEAGVMLSPSNLLGDLGGRYGKGGAFLKDNVISNTKILVGAHFNANPKDWLGLRLAFNYGTVAGDDAMIKSKGGLEELRKARNLNFKSKITEVYIAAEFFPTVFFESNPAEVFHKLRPYGLAGIGVFHFNPQGFDPLTSEWIHLRELHTEGQGFAEYPDRKEYKLIQLNIPIGVGIKYYINDVVSISAEAIHRNTFTDYLDDVSKDYIDADLFYKNLPLDMAIVADRMNDKSANAANRNAGDQRGTPKNNDSFYSCGIKLSFRLGDNLGFKNSIRCPLVRF
ncbi:MAG: DUF6089 family protein [Chitinophagaceae bacterium]